MRRVRRAIHFALTCLITLLAVQHRTAHAIEPDLTDAQQNYIEARHLLRAGNLSHYRQVREQLAGYPLAPYLDYYELRARLERASTEEVLAFSDAHQDTPFAGRLYAAWLTDLAERGAWQSYRDHYRPTDNAEKQCYFLRALLQTGDQARALDAVAPLWLVGHSQPKTCDPLFDRWIASGRLSNDMVWARMRLALAAGEPTLARYLGRFLDESSSRLGATFYQVHRQPKHLRNYQRFSQDDPFVRDVIAHGLPRLVRTDPKDARSAWAHYQSTHQFDTEQALRVDQGMAMALARRGEPVAHANLTPTADGRHLQAADALLVNAVQRQDWSAVLRWNDAVSFKQRAQPKWRYWSGRALAAADHDRSDRAVARHRLQELAQERHYYGFLAANSVGSAPRLHHRSSPPDPAVTSELRKLPAMRRITELVAIEDMVNARREWWLLQDRLDPEHRTAAVYQVADLGWTQQSILAANVAGLHDDLEIRFPTPFRELFVSESVASTVPLNFLYGIARQESAFAPDAESSAGALGMMQLMPSTAALTARRIGMRPPAKPQLKRPEVNLRLGSRYLASLLERYQGNRALTAAAYNAGPRRVDHWLGEVPARPLDIWIESVPFSETRNYVKSVLAFSYIYGEQLGSPVPFIAATEK